VGIRGPCRVGSIVPDPELGAGVGEFHPHPHPGPRGDPGVARRIVMLI